MNRNKSLLFISPVFPPYKAWWWQSQVAWDFAKYLHKKWHKITVVTTEFKWLKKHEDIDGIDVCRFPSFSNLLLKLWLYNPRWLYWWIKKNIKKYDLIFIHDIYTLYGFMVARFCKKNNIPYILMPHGMWNISKQKDKIIVKKIFSFLFSNYVSKNANKIIFCSENEKLDYEIPYRDSVVITNWINQNSWNNELNDITDDDIKSFREKYKLWNKKIIFSMWRLVKVKRFDRTIDYMSSFIKWNDEYMLLIVWPDWWELWNLKQQIKNNWLDKDVKIIEGIFWKDKYIIYKIAKLFVLSSDLEWFPIVLCEAISSKVPCLISKWCNISWSKCFVEIFNDKKDFIDKLNKLIDVWDNIDNSYYKSFDINNTIEKLDNVIINEIK